MQVLLVEDDIRVAAALVGALRRRNYRVTCATSAREALSLPGADLVLLDMGLPDHDGMAVCRELRRRDPDLPIVAVTARGEERDRIAGLRAGVDDYVVKPFSMAELQLRIEAVLRRSVRRTRPPDTLRLGDLWLDNVARTAGLADRPFTLTRKEFDLLLALARHAGDTVSRQELLLTVWQTCGASEHTLDVHIAALRAKIGDPCRIRTVRGIGYQLRA